MKFELNFEKVPFISFQHESNYATTGITNPSIVHCRSATKFGILQDYKVLKESLVPLDHQDTMEHRDIREIEVIWDSVVRLEQQGL